MIKLKIDHDKFHKKIETDRQMNEWHNKTRFTRAAYMHCKRWKSCPLNPFLKDKPSHKHEWEIVKETVIERVTKKIPAPSQEKVSK